MQYNFKIILIGDGGVGKTTFIKRYIYGQFEKRYTATASADIFRLMVMIGENEVINFEIWDTAGQESNSGLSEAYYINAHGAIIFFDITSRITFQHVPDWLRKVRNVDYTESMPIIVVGNKADCHKDRKVDAKRIRQGLPTGIEYTDMSAKSNFNLEVPLLYMARQILNRPNLIFLTDLTVAPPEIFMDDKAIIESEDVKNEMQMAAMGYFQNCGPNEE